ncbi:MAG: single-stranded-DNA-specific exonuclease RecJ [Candidatus Berkelbacteria bacterium]|nr:single-stranded-DNA-specific exonuclease RecJ [Candidatus Berkelbacteria bacterium]
MKNKTSKWKIRSFYPKDVIAEVLKLRKVKDKSAFLNPDYGNLSRPFDIPGLKKAYELIIKTIKEGEPIGIFSDYDADGICGGAVLYRALKKLTRKVYYYVPTREEGYGLNKEGIESFEKSGVGLFVCVDCGIRNVEEVKFAKKLGLKTIIADHHLKGDKLPPAEAIIYPKSASENAPFYNLSGGGIAFMLAKALLKSSGQEKWLVDLAAIATVADIVPLVGDNRIISKFGLLVINKTRNLGLKSLIGEADLKGREIGTYEIGYMIAPRINAAGRISEPIKGFNLLVEQDPEEAKLIAKELNILNSERQNILKKTTEEALKIVEQGKLYKNKVVVVKKADWNDGVVGLVAGKITERYWRPAIVLSQTDDMLRGSARSIPSVNISKLLESSSKHLLSYGGHTQAAGLSLEAKNFEKFGKAILKEAEKIEDKLFEKELIIDALVKVGQLSLGLAKEQETLEPFGQGNPQPVFTLQNIELKDVRKMGRDGNHLRARVCQDGKDCHMVAFGVDKNEWDFKDNKKYDLTFRLKLDRWGGREKVDLILVDSKLS